MRSLRGIAGGLVFALMVSLTAAPSRGDGEEEARRTIELHLVAATIWRAVMARDLDVLLRYVAPKAVGDMRQRLTAANSGLACALFDTQCLQRYLPAADVNRRSVADFFRRQPGATLRIAYIGMPGALGMDSRLDLALATWVVPGSDADRKFPAHDLSRWGVDHVNTCLIHGKAAGWRFHSDVGVFFCPRTLFLRPDAR